MKINILIADDDSSIRSLLKFILSKEGYNVYEAIHGEDASHILAHSQIHLAVIDIMMPFKNGLELCQEIRHLYDIPILLLTAKGELIDKEKGYSSGTDDYLVKPFEPKELIFRIKALLRRYQLISPNFIRMGDIIIDRESYVVKHGNTIIDLPLKEFQLFAQLASNTGRIYTRDQLIQLIWGIDYSGDTRTVDVHIKRLRERFAPYDNQFIITTVRGLGYKLEVLV
ncbi:MAG: response regulator transcription factor [Candidatus Pristimantibacillus lignocellulolyticus]|uniref:Heme response regulator HssR n=1 Tax=Candidatus Pristimantibacillus lignocellulolyticus TaxID=2994561 RepID=A0A9J6ZIC6_9BACL|nr:MAG: response regulator transcription factor [Candidatus Pristimantibacillus lignocellulolyticus]